MPWTLPKAEAAIRLAHAISLQPGVTGAVVCDGEHRPVGAETRGDAIREAALSTLVTARTAALTAPGGDLRGMGRMLVGATLQHVTMAGADGDFVILPCGTGSLFVSLVHGPSPEAVVAGLQTTMLRYL